MKIYFFILSLVFSGMCASCQNNMKTSSKNNCGSAYKQAYGKLNEYYQQEDQRKLDTALAIVEEKCSVLRRLQKADGQFKNQAIDFN